MSKIICYYVTGHGLGHASRTIGVINHLLREGCFVHVVSNVDKLFFEQSMDDFTHHRRNFSFHSRTLDSGAVQDGPLQVNAKATLQKYYEVVHVNREMLIRGEVAFLSESGVQLVLVDATPIACVAAVRAGCFVKLLTNFTWCNIYKQMLQSHCMDMEEDVKLLYESMIQQCENDCCCASSYIQLPGACPLPDGFAGERVLQAPLTAREAVGFVETLKLTALRECFKWVFSATASVKILLLGFGGHSNEWHLKDEFLPLGWVCLVLGAKANEMPSRRFVSLPQTSYVPNYIAIADAVLGKLGFGFVSECVVNATPLIYIPRVCWPEEVFLEQYICGLSAHNALLMCSADFMEGNWSTYLDKASSCKQQLLADPCRSASGVEVLNDTQPGTKASEALSAIVDLILDLSV